MAIADAKSMTVELFGQEMVYGEKSVAYNIIRKKYYDFGQAAAEHLDKFYDEEIHSIEDYRKKVNTFYENIMAKYINFGVLDLIAYGIHDIDDVVFTQILNEKYESETLSAIQKFNDRVGVIEAKMAERLAASKETVEASGNTVKTVGFVTDGSISSTASAMINSAITDSLLNGVAKGFTKMLTSSMDSLANKQDEKKKTDVFSDPENKQNLVSAIKKDVFMIHYIVADLVNEHCGETFYYASVEQKAAIEPVIRNIIHGNFLIEQPDKSLNESKIREMFAINPYDYRLYGCVIASDGKINDELNQIIESFYVDRGALATTYLRALYEIEDSADVELLLEKMQVNDSEGIGSLTGKEVRDYEAAVVLEKEIKEKMTIFGVDTCELYENVKNLKARMTKVRSTFHGFVYGSIIERDAAEVEYNEFMSGVNASEMNLDGIIDKYLETLGGSLEPNNTTYARAVLADMSKSYINKLKNIVDVDKCIDKIEFYAKKYSENDLEMLEFLIKRKKWLETKAKILAAIGSVVSKIVGFFYKIKLKISDLFGKKKKINIPKVKKPDLSKIKSLKSEEIAGETKNAEIPVVEEIKADDENIMVPAAEVAEQVVEIVESKVVEETEKVAETPAAEEIAKEEVEVSVAEEAEQVVEAEEILAVEEIEQEVEKVEIPAAEIVETLVAEKTEQIVEAPAAEETEQVVEKAEMPAAVEAEQVVEIVEEKKVLILDSEYKSCPSCGNKVKIAGKFCGKCGYKF
ncbi:MAG: hypothetical protein MJ113_00050 [Lachnospiraceae bacterium]|nr:hypothetical protein [Lachnospiraceae bacterium]